MPLENFQLGHQSVVVRMDIIQMTLMMPVYLVKMVVVNVHLLLIVPMTLSVLV